MKLTLKSASPTDFSVRTRELTRLRVQKYRNRLHRLRIPAIIRTNDPSFPVIRNCQGQSIPGPSLSTPRSRANPQADPENLHTRTLERLADDVPPEGPQNSNATLERFIQALQVEDTRDDSDSLGPYRVAYDQVFRIFFSSICACSRQLEVDEPEHTHTLQETVEYLQHSLPPLPTIFGKRGSYNPSNFFREWETFLSNQPTQPLSFRKSQAALTPSNLSISQQWDIDSVWFGAKGLQAIRPPNDFKLSFLPPSALNLSTDQVIQPHGLDLAKTRHILMGTFNTQSVRFSAFLFFPHAARDSTSATRNALSLERQKDLYNHIIIPAAFEAISDPSRHEIPRTYDIAYAKSRSFQGKPGNNRWKPDDVSGAFHLQYTVPAQDLSLFWHLVVEKADSLQIPTQRGEMVSYFKNPRLLFQSHDLKNTFGQRTLEETLNLFQQIVLQAFDPIHLDIRSCWLDIGDQSFILFYGRVNAIITFMSNSAKLLQKLDSVPHIFAAFSFEISGPTSPGIILAKAYNCNKELFSVMFSDYDLFGSGFLPLLALNEEMINDLSSATQGRHQAPTSRFNALASYGIRREMTFRLDAIFSMWHRGYFQPNQNPHIGQRVWNLSFVSELTEHHPFWVVPTRDINALIFTQAARLVLPLDHLFQEPALNFAVSSPCLILAFYTAQLSCRLLTYTLTSEQQFPYDNWIWLPRWRVQHRRAHQAGSLLERQGLGVDVSIRNSGMLWIPQECMDWYGGHIALHTLIQLYIPRNPFQRGLLSQMNVQCLTASKVTIELSLRQLLQQARLEFDHGRRHKADRLVESIVCLVTEEVARAYHQHMLSKLQLYWGRLRTQVGYNILPRLLKRLQQAQEESAMQVGRIVTAQTIWEVYDEAWTAYIRTQPTTQSEEMPSDHLAGWRPEKICHQKMAGPVLISSASFNFKGFWEMIQDYAGSFDDRFSRIIGNFILVTFNSDHTKEVGTNRKPAPWHVHQVTFFQIQYWAPYFSPPGSAFNSSWDSVEDYQHRHPGIPPGTISSAVNAGEFQRYSSTFEHLWLRVLIRHDQLQEAKARGMNRICQQVMQCLVDLVGPPWSYEGDLAFVLPWKFSKPTVEARQHEDHFRVPILTKSARFSTKPCQPTILLPSRHNAMALIDAIESLPRLNRMSFGELNGS
ncbi:hypothetical protein EDB80DRAFT_875320 [Ilyonectria destructans]|nr:hypothetical protein EDB80DRAFT_875320 [Ilyonectria destructans]